MTLIERLRALARGEHDDLSIGDEAADALEAAQAIADAMAKERKRMKQYIPWSHGEHEWEEAEYDSGGGKPDAEEVECRLCGVPGERTISTGDVFWPAT